MSRYKLTSQAEGDFAELLLYVAADDIDAAIRLNDRFTNLFELMAQNPEMGRERPEINEGLRSFPEGNYIVFYRIWAGRVTIARILHAARDLDELFS